jgi:hypothetical protein
MAFCIVFHFVSGIQLPRFFIDGDRGLGFLNDRTAILANDAVFESALILDIRFPSAFFAFLASRAVIAKRLVGAAIIIDVSDACFANRAE